MKVLILGDTHGEWGEINIVVARAFRLFPDITAIVQVGDLGYAWPGKEPFVWLKKYWDNADFDRVQRIPFYFLDGNHENHDQLDLDQGAYQPNMIYKSRGSINTFYAADITTRRAMFFGGATSPDKDYRTEFISWWSQESIKQGQLMTALAQENPIDIVFSHEHPEGFNYKNGKYKNGIGKNDKAALDAVRLHFKPKLWVFGHYHEFEEGQVEGTQWMCAPVINTRMAILWDGDTLTPIQL